MIKGSVQPYDAAIKVDITDLRCRVCSNAFDKIENIATHLSSEHSVSNLNISHDLGVHPFKIYKGVNICILCSEKFVTLRALCRHAQTHYLNYTCETCGKSYSNKRSLTDHTKFAHLVFKYRCRKCRLIFNSSEQNQRHKTESRSCWEYSCRVCGQKFRLRSQKQKHLRDAHNDTSGYVCPECPEIFINKSCRQAHFMAAHTDKYKCSYCNKTFSTNTNLTIHSVVHSGEKFRCDICLKEYSRKKLLKQHMKIHMGKQSVVCGLKKAI